MRRRNWLQLARKLIDRYDFDNTMNWIVAAIGKEVLARQADCILPTVAYPNPFVTALSGSAMTGTVTGGVCWDATGQRVEASTVTPFTLTSDPTLPRWALLVARYATNGLNSIAQPSNPGNTIFEDLDDSFQIAVILGTPNASPAYPAKTAATDVVLMGYKIPAAATNAAACTEDKTVRQQGAYGKADITSAYSATAADKDLYVNALSAGVPVTLPPSLFSEGAEITVYKTDSSGNSVTVLPNGTDTILGVNSGSGGQTIDSQYGSLTFKLRGTTWYVK